MPIAQAHVDYSFLRRIVEARSRNVLDPARDYAFEVRLARLVRDNGMTSLAELVQHLRHSGDTTLETAVADAMTNNETSFFRDRRPFELLRTRLLPELIAARSSTRTLRLWSAGCSTGQEAYSLAMLLREHFPLLGNWNVQVEANDICRQVVDRAQAGSYESLEVNRGLPLQYLNRYFHRHGDRWVIKPVIRSMCRFQVSNLCQAHVLMRGRFDVILLRNVMLYFAPESRRAVMAEIHRMLEPDGVLIMGSSEQPADASLWISDVAGGTCYFRPRNGA